MREDWIEIKIGDIFTTVTGNTPSKKNPENYGGIIPFVKPPDILNSIIKSSEEFISDVGKSKARILPVNSVLVTCIGNLGRVGINTKSEVAYNQQINAIYPSLYIHPIYIYYQAQNLSFRAQLEKLSTSTTVALVNKSNFDTIKVKLAPLSEQRAIVKKIEQLFSSLDASITYLKKAQGQLKIYRQAVLKKAFESYEFNKKLKEISICISDGDHQPPPKSEIGIPFITISNVDKSNNKIDFQNTFKVKSDYFSNLKENRRPLKGDVLYTVTGSFGIPILIDYEKDFCFQRHIGLIRPLITTNSKWLFYLLQTPQIYSQASASATGTAQKTVSLNSLRNFNVPCPFFEEQHQIVKEIESRLSVCDAVEEQIKTSLDKAEALRQSILKKAFAGALLTQTELEACRKEPDYEPASVLLEKIKSEKQTGKKNTKKEKAIIPAKPAVAAIEKISADIQAGLIAKVIRLHEDNPQHHTLLTHIKCEKLSHLVEYHLQIPLGRQPVKDAAGPDDYPRLKKVEHRAKMAGYFSVQKNKIGHTYVSGKGIEKAITQFEKNLSEEQKQRVDQLLHLFLTFDLEQAEIVATIYAAWNNLLILGKKRPTDEEIVQEARYNWSDRKLGLEEHRFYKAIEWMQKDTVNLIPTGYGTLVDFPKKKK